MHSLRSRMRGAKGKLGLDEPGRNRCNDHGINLSLLPGLQRSHPPAESQGMAGQGVGRETRYGRESAPVPECGLSRPLVKSIKNPARDSRLGLKFETIWLHISYQC